LFQLLFGGNPLDTSRLEAIHAQRVEWMKKRVVRPAQGVYFDLRAVRANGKLEDLIKAAKQTEVQVLFVDGVAAPENRAGILIAPVPADLPRWDEPERPPAEVLNPRTVRDRFKLFPDEVLDIAGPAAAPDHDPAALRRTGIHILARDLGSALESLEQGRAYVAHDWLCDPAGFSFVAENNFGTYEIGDMAPLMNGTALAVTLPIQGSIRILRDDTVVAEKNDSRIVYPVKDLGSYRAEVSVSIAGEERPWIQTKAIHIGKPNFAMPMTQTSPDVEVHKDLAYVDDGEAKHRLDLYVPKAARSFPVMIFYHGGAWHTGDRSQYPPFGNRFAKAGIGVAIPSYRLMPQSRHPAQIEDAAAAFAWVYRNIAQFGGDTSRIFIAGHSAGGHLVTLLALDPQWLKKHDISPGAIRGVASMSGVYNVEDLAGFTGRRASPIEYVHPRMPPFLISYCQWDYLGLPKQARDFAGALKKEFGDVKLLYIPGESHISEIIATLKDDDPLARALLDFVK
jgi:acetyl esterase/lipase